MVKQVIPDFFPPHKKNNYSVIPDFVPPHKKNNHSKTRHYWENPEAHHSTTKPVKDCIRRVREAVVHWSHCASPSHLYKSPLSLWFFQWRKGTQWKKGRQSTPTPSARIPSLYLYSTQWDYREIWLWQLWRGRTCNNQHVDLDRLNSYLQCSSSNPNQ